MTSEATRMTPYADDSIEGDGASGSGQSAEVNPPCATEAQPLAADAKEPLPEVLPVLLDPLVLLELPVLLESLLPDSLEELPELLEDPLPELDPLPDPDELPEPELELPGSSSS